jgi:hypothetical protein
VIGAPLHTDFSLSGGRYETGRVYVVYQNREVRSYCYYMYYTCIAWFWIRIRIRIVSGFHPGQCIRIRIRNPDPGGQK